MSGFSLKDHLFNRAKVEYLAGLLESADATFRGRKFVAQVMEQLLDLELKQRIVLIADTLQQHLPTEFPKAARTIVASLPPPLDPQKTDDDFGDFIFAPFGEYVVRQGMSPRHLNVALSTLKQLTMRFSMEDSLRAFIRQYPDPTLREIHRWKTDKNYHVRRLVSESTRPLLPWSGRIDLPVSKTLPLLDALHADSTRYVTRSVANHLNDIAKTNPDLVIETLTAWRERAQQREEELHWMTRHALRTLVKAGHAGALKLLGFSPHPKISIDNFRLAKTRLRPGETLQFSLDITAKKSEALVVDYAIDFVKAGGKRAAKVFKATKLQVSAGETVTVAKKHKLLANATTFKLYPGRHSVTIQINGQSLGSQDFTLE